MSNRLGGKQGTAYLGTNADQPPNWTFSDRDPNGNDINNVSLGDLWLNQGSENVFVLVSLAGNSMSKGSVATWTKLEAGGISALNSLTGNTGGVVNADASANINIISGVTGFSFDGNPATNTITLNSTIGSSPVQTVTGNEGGPVSPLVGNLNIIGDDVGITTTGDPGTGTLTISLIGGGGAPEDFPTDAGTAIASGGVLNINAGNASNNSGSSVTFSGSGNTVQLNLSDVLDNTILGENAGNNSLTGIFNTAIGTGALTDLTSGTHNVVIGNDAGHAIHTGSYNAFLGFGAGAGYTTSESSNITINANGNATDSNTLTLGSGTGTGTYQINKAVISGIYGITPEFGGGIPVFINSNDQLGTVGNGTGLIQTVTGNSGGAVGPLAGNINIVGDGSTATVVGNPGTNTLTISAIGGGGGDLTILAGDIGSATPTAGTINIITDVAAQQCGSSIQFEGSSSTIELSVTDANSNTIIGFGSGNATLSGLNNTAFGNENAVALTSGASNTILGSDAGAGLTTGSLNVIVGADAGSSYASSESSNIVINATGTAAQSNALIIGSGTGTGSKQINKAFISGIRGITPATTDGIPVFIGSAGQLGTVGTGGTTLIQTVTGNSGGAVGPLAGNINIVGDGSTATVVGNPGTNTLTISAIGGGGGDLTVLAGDTGSATPTAGTITIKANVAAQYCGATVEFTGSGSTIELNVSDSDNNTIIGSDSGNGTFSGTNNTVYGVDCATALTTGSNNTLIGINSGSFITTGSGNFICGNGNLNTIIKGSTTATGFYGFGAGSSSALFLHNFGGSVTGNTFLGYGAGSSFNAGQQASNITNTGCGVVSLAALTTGQKNTGIGGGAGAGITSGSYNTLLGTGSGLNYTSSESSNICIGYNATGNIATSNAITIGAGTGTGTGQINKTFISGIRGITVGAANGIPVVVDSNGQLGTAGGSGFISTVTGNTGGSVPGSSGGNLNVIGDGSTVTVVGNPGTNTLTISAIGGGSGTSIPLFSVYVANNINSVTGSGSAPGFPYQIIYDTAFYNEGSNFNLSTGIFTAPYTGVYNFAVNTGVNNLNALNASGSFSLVSSSFVNGFYYFQGSPAAMRGTVSVQNRIVQSGNFYIDMDSGDTLYSSIVIYGNTPSGSNNVNVSGSSGGLSTSLSGQYVGVL
jgi:hypothetical protein